MRFRIPQWLPLLIAEHTLTEWRIRNTSDGFPYRVTAGCSIKETLVLKVSCRLGRQPSILSPVAQRTETVTLLITARSEVKVLYILTPHIRVGTWPV